MELTVSEWEKVCEKVQEAIKIACSIMNARFDDEYVSIGNMKAIYAVNKFDQSKTKRDVFEFVEYTVIRCIKLYIRLKTIRNKKYPSMSAIEQARKSSDTRILKIDPVEDRLDPLGSAMLLEFYETEPDVAKCIEETGRVTRKHTYKKRKTWLISKMIKDRLKRENQKEATDNRSTQDGSERQETIEASGTP